MLAEHSAINVAHACVTEAVNGPGRRFTVWVQGCARACPGCFNPALQSFEPRKTMAPESLASEAERRRPWEGITLTGGEPFAQAASLAAFLRDLEARQGQRVPVVAFSGYCVAQLREGPNEWKDLLRYVDLLVDGPYRGDLSRGGALCASANQTLVILTKAGEVLAAAIEASPPCDFQVVIDEAGELILTGFPSPLVVAQLKRGLGYSGDQGIRSE